MKWEVEEEKTNIELFPFKPHIFQVHKVAVKVNSFYKLLRFYNDVSIQHTTCPSLQVELVTSSSMDHGCEEKIILLSGNLEIAGKQTFAFEDPWVDGLDSAYLESLN